MMFGFIEDLKNTFFGNLLNYIKRIFKTTLERDRRKKAKYKGFPSPTTKTLSRVGKEIGVKIVDADRRDFTLYPLLNQYKSFFGGDKSIIYKGLLILNRKLFGGFTNLSRFNTQIQFLESYKDYAETFDPTVVLENIIDKKIPYYLLKILEKFRVDAEEEGMSLKAFIKNNADYFTEISVFFDFEDKADLSCLGEALTELLARKEATKRSYIVRGSMLNALAEILILIISFGKVVIPEIISSFESSIDDFSAPIRFVDKLSIFIINKWYFAIPVALLIYALFKTKPMRLITGYLAIKIPFIRNYVVNDQLLRFLKSYTNLISSKGIRESYVDSLKMLENEFIKFIFETYVEGLGGTGISFYVAMEAIPYIPKEYIDILKENEELGNPEEGVKKVINVIEPRIEKLVKTFTKQLILSALIISAIVVAILSYYVFTDMSQIINKYNKDFVDRLRN